MRVTSAGSCDDDLVELGGGALGVFDGLDDARGDFRQRRQRGNALHGGAHARLRVRYRLRWRPHTSSPSFLYQFFIERRRRDLICDEFAAQATSRRFRDARTCAILRRRLRRRKRFPAAGPRGVPYLAHRARDRSAAVGNVDDVAAALAAALARSDIHHWRAEAARFDDPARAVAHQHRRIAQQAQEVSLGTSRSR
jgi:hypothetical protein